MHFSSILSFKPLSLMNSSRLFRNFIFLFSLLGIGSFAWGDRYETVFVYTEDTAVMSTTNAQAYLQSNETLSTQTLTIPEGEVASIFSSGAISKPNSTTDRESSIKGAYIHGIVIDINGLDSNISRVSRVLTWNSSDANVNNYDSSDPIVGPATVRVRIKPWSGRGGSNNDSARWSYTYGSGYTDWDFKASEGFITFRITGSEQAPSKKFATVIPENASGNIRIVLEQSTDLINWTTASPGVFPPSTAKRFFRVRSEEE